MDEQTKTCCTCRHALPLADFARSKQCGDGYHWRCKECCKASNTRYYERLKAEGQPYAPQKRYDARNPEKVQELRQQWAAENVAVHAVHLQRSKDSRRLRITPETVESIPLRAVYDRAGDICYLCNRSIALQDAHRDHVVPLSKGGTHTWANIRLACRACNCRKGTRLLSELDWYHYGA